MTTYEVDFYAETCCDDCGNVVHNHFDCPICLKEYAGTSVYMAVYESDYENFSCEECKSEFKFESNKTNENFNYVVSLVSKE